LSSKLKQIKTLTRDNYYLVFDENLSLTRIETTDKNKLVANGEYFLG